ncbi:ATP-binding protein [Pseudoduganella armeniaca]|uniref:histidine kinase n=1 Tax=Pseudoduganella armeniaca TaxID=2072590 RepID=A0A2R4CDU4_9BURK|nr:ATP-binding protein [Pseudoduganella armeniaca]AVR97766.1 two-component sensor histidine kinase [Pseudoduganella armeniaca]
MKRLLRPTLARRVMLALLLAFALVWLVLMARQFLVATDQDAIDANLRALGQNMLASIAPIARADAARAVVAATSTLVNNSYRSNDVPGVVLMELRDAAGRRLFLSPEGGQASLGAGRTAIGDVKVAGQRYRLYVGRTARWTLLVAAPHLEPAWILRSMMGSLTLDMLIAFPFVLLPVWIAVSGGLRPLRRLSQGIAARGPDDLAPLDHVPRHAELRPLAAALDRLLTQLRGRLAREQGFVQDAAHELRTPLAVISAQAHVLVRARDAAARMEARQRMDAAVMRASHLVGQLLTLAQIGNRHEPALAATDLAQLLRAELALLVPGALARGIELSLDAPETLVAPTDVHAFQSIVQNLAGNALAYVPAGRQVRVALAARPDGWCLTVADDGPGIPIAERALVFERFHRGSGHDVPGAGLGLAIVREAAARLGGGVVLGEGIGGRGAGLP